MSNFGFRHTGLRRAGRRAVAGVAALLAVAGCSESESHPAGATASTSNIADVPGRVETAVTAEMPPDAKRLEPELQSAPGITGHVEVLRGFPSEFVTPRDLHIRLPQSYSEGEARYPVVYVHDGQNLYDPALSKYSQTDWGFDEAMEELVRTGRAREAIIVGIASLEDERFENYMPQKAMTPEVEERVRSNFAMNGWPLGEVNSDDYLRFVVEEVKPYVDANYRTLPGREDTSMIGASMGGLITTYALMEYPDVFGSAAGVSTHLPLAGGALVDYFGGRLPDPGRTRVYYDYGTETLDAEYEEPHLRLDALMREAGFGEGKYVMEKFDGHSHSEIDWRTRVDQPLEFLLGAPE